MSYDGTIIFDTKMDTEGFEEGVKRLRDIIKGMDVFKLLKTGSDLVSDLVSESVDKAMGRIDAMERFSRVMNTMVGDVQLVNKALADTEEMVAGTAYGFDAAAQAVQNFVSRGMEVRDATDTVRAWGDAVAFYGDGSNATFASVTDALSKMQTKGNVAMEHMELLLNAGIPAIELYGDAVGMTTSEVTEAMSAGKLKASDFVGTLNTAMAEGTAKFPALAGAAKQAGASWSGTFDNMRAAVTRGVQNIISAIDDTQAAMGRPTMREAVSSFGKSFEKALDLVTKAIPPLLKNLDLIAIGAAAVGVSLAAIKAGPIIVSLIQGFQMAAVQMVMYTKSVQGAITAEAMQAAGLTAKEVLIGVVTGKIGLATAAQWLWNAAVKANPIGVFVTLVAAAIAGITALITAMIKWDVASSEQKQEVDALCESQKKLTESIKESQEAAEKNAAALEDDAKSTNTLFASLKALADKEQRSAADKRMLAIYVDKLNAAQEGLNLSYDEQADLLSMGTKELEGYIEAKQDMERFTAYIDRQNELLKEQAQIEEDLAVARKKQAEVNAQFKAGELSQRQYDDQINELNTSVQQYVLDQQDTADRLGIINEQIANIDTAKAQTIIQNAEDIQTAAQATAEATEEEMQRRADALQSYTDVATNMFSRLNAESELSTQDMIDNLEYNQQTLSQWADNLAALGERVNSEGEKVVDEGLLQALRDAGPEAAGAVAELASASDEQLLYLSEVYAKGGEAAAEALLTTLGLPEAPETGAELVEGMAQGVQDSTSLADATVQMITDAKAAAEQQVEASNFPTVGQLITAGIAEGIRNGASAIVEAAKAAVTAAMDAARSAAEINSPSKKARREIGRPWAQGVGLGILDETDSVTAHAVEMMAQINQEMQRGAFGPGGLHGVMDQFRAAVDYTHSLAGLRGGLPGVALQAAPAAYAPVSNEQTINIYQPVETPDETARAIRLQMTYGLAGDMA